MANPSLVVEGGRGMVIFFVGGCEGGDVGVSVRFIFVFCVLCRGCIIWFCLVLPVDCIWISMGSCECDFTISLPRYLGIWLLLFGWYVPRLMDLVSLFTTPRWYD